jgi:molecular chaperone DnaK (HSP70)
VADQNLLLTFRSLGEELAAMMLRKLGSFAQKATTATAARSVVTHPAWWNLQQKQALLSAAYLAGIPALLTLSDLTAVAVLYGGLLSFSCPTN